MKRLFIIISIVVVLLVGVTAIFKEPPVLAQSSNLTDSRERDAENQFSKSIKQIDSLLDEIPVKKESVKCTGKSKLKRVYIKPAVENVVIVCNDNVIEQEVERVKGKLVINADSVCAIMTQDSHSSKLRSQKKNLFQRIFNRKK